MSEACSTALSPCSSFFFFFQAVDGIRDRDVTGVQTCALPISSGVIPDISADQVALAGGSSLEELRRAGDRGTAVDVMIEGVKKLVQQQYEAGNFDAVLSLGGGAGTNVATAGMRELPVGVPKVMVSTLASSDVSAYVGVKDITMMFSD